MVSGDLFRRGDNAVRVVGGWGVGRGGGGSRGRRVGGRLIHSRVYTKIH